jgi:hypothetical protein
MSVNFGYNTLKTSGSVINSLNFIFIAEGFLASEQTAFNLACLDKMNSILSQSPFKENALLFNFYSINVVSLESGITHPFSCGAQCSGVIPAMPQKMVNSYFGLCYDCEGLHRFILPTYAQSNLIFDTIKANIPFYNPNLSNFEPIVICNDINYGGSEQGEIATTTLHTQSDEVLLHELGHSLAGLDDEYIGATLMESWNLTQTTNFANVRWAKLESQGANLVQLGTSGWYKPTARCKMNTLGVPYCVVCNNQLIISFQELITKAGGKPATAPVLTSPASPINNSPITSVWLATGPSDSPYIECNNVTGAKNYIYTITSPGLQTISITSNNVAKVNLRAKTTYSIVVVAVLDSDNSLPSTPFTFTTP